MSCFELQTVYFAINYTLRVVANTTGTCDNTDACSQAYCELNKRPGVDWICFSASQANDIIDSPMKTWLNCLYAVLAFFFVYSAIVTILYVRGTRTDSRDNGDPEKMPLLLHEERTTLCSR